MVYVTKEIVSSPFCYHNLSWVIVGRGLGGGDVLFVVIGGGDVVVGSRAAVVAVVVARLFSSN